MNTELITPDFIIGSPKSGGVEAKFIKMDNKWGFKYWLDKTDRDDNYRFQAHASKHGLAPMVGEKKEISMPSGVTYYGFVTEICPTLLSDHEDWYDIEYTWKWIWSNKDDSNISFPAHGLPDLYNQLKKVGFDRVSDLHAHNVGFMDDGRFVCIDFGYFSLRK